MALDQPAMDLPGLSTQDVRHVVLVGLMGSGKTTVGRLMAERLAWPLCDSDIEIESRLGLTAREIAAERGAEYLHRLEADHLIAAISSSTPRVICPAASTIEDACCRGALLSHDIFVAWLRATPATLVGRFGNESHRPSYFADIRDAFDHQIETREELFRAIKPYVLDVGEIEPDEAADLLFSQISSRRASCPKLTP